MDQAPPEICAKIFSVACTDTGYTGQSISLVSKYIHETSGPYRLQSISLHGHDEIIAFAALLNKTPPHLRRVRHLFISTQNRDEDDTSGYVYFSNLANKRRKAQALLASDEEGKQKKDEIMQDYDRQNAEWKERSEARQLKDQRQGPLIAAAIEHILQTVASSLEVLEVDFEYFTSANLTRAISFPSLTDLTSHGGYPLAPSDHTGPLITPCHNLRRLHIGCTGNHVRGCHIFEQVPVLAPCLTHLRMSGLQQDGWVGGALREALGFHQEWATGSPVDLFPETIERILIKPDRPPAPGGWCGTSYFEYSSLLSGTREVQEMDDRVTLLPAETGGRRFGSLVPISERDWLNRIGGGEGCWREK